MSAHLALTYFTSNISEVKYFLHASLFLGQGVVGRDVEKLILLSCSSCLNSYILFLVILPVWGLASDYT